MASAIHFETKSPVDVHLQRDTSRSSLLKKTALIACSILMAIGLVLSYTLGAPWLLMVGFFALALCPLFRMGQAVDSQRKKILIK